MAREEKEEKEGMSCTEEEEKRTERTRSVLVAACVRWLLLLSLGSLT